MARDFLSDELLRAEYGLGEDEDELIVRSPADPHRFTACTSSRDEGAGPPSLDFAPTTDAMAKTEADLELDFRSAARRTSRANSSTAGREDSRKMREIGHGGLGGATSRLSDLRGLGARGSLPPLTPPPITSRPLVPPPLFPPPPRVPAAQASRKLPGLGTSLGESARARTIKQDFREGDILAEKYCVVRTLGKSGVGVVLLVRHVELGQHFLFKYLPQEVCSYPDTVARFLRGARSALQLTSEHTARTTDAGRLSSGIPYVVTEFLDGSRLRDLLRIQGGLLISEAVDIVLQAAVAVAEAHRHGIVHGSLNPSTLFVVEAPDGSSFVKVMDFGVTLGADALHGTDLLNASTDTERAIEALSCTAPEQIRRAGDVDARTDVWALGALLFEALTGSPAYQADNVAGMLAMIAADPAPALTSHLPDAPAALERVLLRALEKERRARYASVAELAAALRPFASPECEGLVDQITRTLGRSSRAMDARAVVRIGPAPASEPVPRLAQGSTFQRYQVIAGASLIAGGLFGGTILAALLVRSSLSQAVQSSSERPLAAKTTLSVNAAVPASNGATPEPTSRAPLEKGPQWLEEVPISARPPAQPSSPPPRPAPTPARLFQPVTANPGTPPARAAQAPAAVPSEPQDRWGIDATNASAARANPAPEKVSTGRLSLFNDVK